MSQPFDRTEDKAVDWTRRGISTHPDQDDEFAEIIGYDSYSRHVRNLIDAFIVCYQYHKERGEFVRPEDLPEQMAEAYLEQQRSDSGKAEPVSAD